MREKAVKNSVCVHACVAGCTPSILGRMGREVISEAGGGFKGHRFQFHKMKRGTEMDGEDYATL